MLTELYFVFLRRVMARSKPLWLWVWCWRRLFVLCQIVKHVQRTNWREAGRYLKQF